MRTADSVYLVETKAQAQVIHPNVQRKGARLAELLDYARLRPLAAASLQSNLAF